MPALMLPPEADRWTQVETAYRNGPEVADWLRRLVEGREDRAVVWEEVHSRDFWGALVHQGTVYEAAYKALPYLIQVAAELGADSPARSGMLIFVGAIFGESGPFADGAAASPAALELRGHAHAAACLILPTLLACRDEEDARYLLGALAALSEQHRLFHILFSMDTDDLWDQL